MHRFSSLYRIQLSPQCTFSSVKKLIPYLKELGVEGIYFSPYFDSCNSHGYDIVDATKINFKLGTLEELKELIREMHENQLAHIMDVVPNHMGIKGGNPWWEDLLAKGPQSQYASFFDINWNSEKKELHNKILLPILQASYHQLLIQQEIELRKVKEGYAFFYQEYQLPLASFTYPREAEVEAINKAPERMHELLEKQYYRLAYWAVASHEINYRRFFNINELAALRIEEEEVLEAHHKLIFTLMKEGVVDGVRIDHPDGFYYPAAYFKQLKARADLPLFVEKILGYQERIPSEWQVEGTVGYEYLNALNALFVYPKNEEKIHSIYERFVGKSMNFEEILYHSKKLYTNRHMVSEIENLALILDQITESYLQYREYTRFELTEALQEIISSFSVYRTYISPWGMPSSDDRLLIQKAIAKARKRARWLVPSLFDFFEKLLLCELPESDLPSFRGFIMRLQQLTGPIMAKGLEDTAFYIFNRLISLNEVGADLEHFALIPKSFHEKQKEKLHRWPLGFFPSSTHDTKRSEDVRMRIHLMSELAEEWEEHLYRWPSIEGISKNDLYFIYQTLLGVWPQETLTEQKKEEFLELRLWPSFRKSIREAGEGSSWQQPNDDYEMKVYTFVKTLLSDPSFLQSFLPFQKKIDYYGTLNSLSAQVIRLGSCAVIDIYQGNERLSYSLMDPDNRREVDYRALEAMISKIKEVEGITLFQEKRFDELKLWLLRRMLHIRRKMEGFFLSADYIPIYGEGEGEGYIAYLRKDQKRTLLVLARRFYATFPGKELHVQLPKEYEGVFFRSLFTVQKFQNMGGVFPLEECFSQLPFQWCIHEEENHSWSQ